MGELLEKQLLPLIFDCCELKWMSHQWNQDFYAVVRAETGDDTQHDIGGQQLLLGEVEYGRNFTEYVLNQDQPKEDKYDICERMDNRWTGVTNDFQLDNPSDIDWSEQQRDQEGFEC